MATAEAEAFNEYRVYAYVCSVTCVRRVDQDPPPSATFTQIYRLRPADCRYAVVGVWDFNLNSDRFIVWDLFNVLKNPATGNLAMPRPRLQHTDLDAAIMATVLLYNKEAKR
jgi:hypothetical protein